MAENPTAHSAYAHPTLILRTIFAHLTTTSVHPTHITRTKSYAHTSTHTPAYGSIASTYGQIIRIQGTERDVKVGLGQHLAVRLHHFNHDAVQGVVFFLSLIHI